MPRNVELIQKLFGSKQPLPSIELADNALKLGGILANMYALKSDLNGEVDIVLGNIDAVIRDLEAHKDDDVRHLTQGQIDKISSAIDSAKAMTIALQAINNEKAGIIAEAVQSATKQSEDYTDGEVANLKANLEKQIGNLNVPEIVDPETGETTDKTLSETLETSPQNLINPQYFYRFKNMMENSSFEVFDGNTMIPLGWDNGVVSADAAMFNTYSLKLTTGQTSKQTGRFQTDVTWLKGAYDTDDVVLCFYHKLDSVTVRVYDVVNESYLKLTKLSSELEEGDSGVSAKFPYAENWNQYRCMVKFTPNSNTRRIRVEFTCESGPKGACYIDAPSMEPYEQGQFPSIYKDGRYSVSAYQILNPPPADVDRFTALEHFSIGNSISDDKGNLTYQELLRSDGSLAIKRQASNKDEASGQYKTIVETFYKKDGSVNYTDTYSYTYSSSGAILTRTKTTTEVT